MRRSTIGQRRLRPALPRKRHVSCPIECSGCSPNAIRPRTDVRLLSLESARTVH
jgi:hypothetical protein